ncbi:septum formation inhibitor Maf [Pseudoxanthomonas sp. NC8]|nr:septum formation inhibitor Maf [Pseudoxanthomonas sp. NC8]
MGHGSASCRRLSCAHAVSGFEIPRRAELLQRLGLTYRLLDVDVPEVRAPGEGADAYVRRVARDKARAGWADVAGEADACVLGADTEVVLDDEVFGKPADAADAAAMLRRLSGRSHAVLSAVVVIDAAGEREVLSVTEVRFAPLSDADIAAYVATGEAMGKAGAYAIQGRAEAFVEHLTGSYSGVMGLPVHDTARLLRNRAGAPADTGACAATAG